MEIDQQELFIHLQNVLDILSNHTEWGDFMTEAERQQIMAAWEFWGKIMNALMNGEKVPVKLYD